MGIVAWPPQVTMFTFGSEMCSDKFTGGMT